MGSFLLCCTIVSFLQMKQRLSRYLNAPNHWNLGCLLMEYLQLYSNGFNYFAAGIVLTDNGRYFPKSDWSNISGESTTLPALAATATATAGNPGNDSASTPVVSTPSTGFRYNHSLLIILMIIILRSLMWPRPGLLCVQNPDVPDQDVGRSSYLMLKIRKAMEQALQLLTAAMSNYHEYSYLCYVIRGDDPLLVNRLTGDSKSQLQST
jgi:hypothetical protein